MRKPASMKGLEELGRKRLSQHFFMRDMFYSEIANFHRIQNIPDNPDLAIAAGKRLCEELLEPLHATFGHVSVRSAYRSVEVNTYGSENKHNCASSERPYRSNRMPRYSLVRGLSGQSAGHVVESDGLVGPRPSALFGNGILPEKRRLQS